MIRPPPRSPCFPYPTLSRPLPPELRAGAPHHGHLRDAGTALEHLLDLPGVDVVAAGDDQLLFPAAYSEVPVLPYGPQIAGPEPARVVEALGGGLRTVPVAREDVHAPDLDLADLPGQQRL